jgi:uncharacterized protein
MAALFVLLIRLYQLTLSKLLVALMGPLCRFEPSCSRYAILCLQGHGVLRGSLLSAKRLCRCHPFHPGGFDPPPPPRGDSGQSTVRHQSGDADAPT